MHRRRLWGRCWFRYHNGARGRSGGISQAPPLVSGCVCSGMRTFGIGDQPYAISDASGVTRCGPVAGHHGPPPESAARSSGKGCLPAMVSKRLARQTMIDAAVLPSHIPFGNCLGLGITPKAARLGEGQYRLRSRLCPGHGTKDPSASRDRSNDNSLPGQAPSGVYHRDGQREQGDTGSPHRAVRGGKRLPNRRDSPSAFTSGNVPLSDMILGFLLTYRQSCQDPPGSWVMPATFRRNT